ncbi:ClpP/crotonase-like domain-containing protein [Camillea tinctor]|nr:ClpP/crotonase-like domain-containing protein [Camillea tinctor]
MTKPTTPTTTPPPPVPHTLISFPSPHILLVTLNRPAQLNAIPQPQHFALSHLWDWFDAEPALRAAILTGSGRAFCAGADLKEWDTINADASPPSGEEAKGGKIPPSGFGGLSNRPGKKPVIAAVNGLCLGGGMEMLLNCDIVVAAPAAQFALPEVRIGVIAVAGGLPRLAHSVGRQRAMEMALTGKRYGAREMREWGLVNEVVGEGEVVEAALRWAEMIVRNSPDAVVVSREGVRMAWEGVGAVQATELVKEGWYKRMEGGENMREGIRSFVERRKPVWRDSKL